MGQRHASGTAPPFACSLAMIIEMTPAAAKGMGMPTKKLEPPPCGERMASTLKRARRRAPQAAKRNAAEMPTRPRSASAHFHTSSAGAAPKVMTSARESSSWPNMLWVFVRRATRPSKPSKKMPKKMARAAW